MVDNVTDNRGYQLPDPNNFLDGDVLRIIAALQALDVDMSTVLAALALKAAASHTHSLAEVAGLIDALASKSATGHTHTLAGLTDVDIAGIANGQFIRWDGTKFIPVAIDGGMIGTGTIDAARLGAHGHAISDVTGLVSALTDKASVSAVTAALADKLNVAAASAAGLSMLGAADVAAQTALLNSATTVLKGLMSAADKEKLDGCSAEKFVFGSVANGNLVLSNSAVHQRIFKELAEGSFYFDVGLWEFGLMGGVSAMSATSGNAALALTNMTPAGGMAVISEYSGVVAGADGTTVSVNRYGLPSAIQMPTITNATGTTMVFDWRGTFRVTAAGWLIPSIALFTAAAAQLYERTQFYARRLGDVPAGQFVGTTA